METQTFETSKGTLMAADKTCKHCGSILSPGKSTKIYCSNICASKYKIRKRRMDFIAKSEKVKSVAGEIWRYVKDYEGIYSVSNIGRVKSLNYKQTGAESILKPHTTKLGYSSVSLNKDGRVKVMRVHRLVAMAFIPNPNNKPYINHIDNNPLNNNLSNLEWVTPKENTHHALRQGRMICNITPEINRLGQVLRMRPVIDNSSGVVYSSVAEAARKTGLVMQTLYSWVSGASPNKSSFSFYKK